MGKIISIAIALTQIHVEERHGTSQKTFDKMI